MNQRIFFLIYLLIFQLTFTSFLFSQPAIDFKDRGIAEFKSERYNEAAILFTHAIASDSTLAEAYLFRGESRLHTFEYKYAITDITKAIELNPFFIDAYMSRAEVYASNCLYTSAIEDLTKVIELQPGNIEAYYARGIVNMDAEIEFNTMIYGKQRTAHKSSKSFIPAIADFSKVIELDSENEKAYFSRGEVFFQLEKYSEALADFYKASDINPINWEALNYSGMINFNSGNYTEAVRLLSYSIIINPDLNNAYYLRGKTYFFLGKLDASRRDLETAIEMVNYDAQKFLEEHFK